jgi:hypothetical protein
VLGSLEIMISIIVLDLMLEIVHVVISACHKGQRSTGVVVVPSIGGVKELAESLLKSSFQCLDLATCAIARHGWNHVDFVWHN